MDISELQDNQTHIISFDVGIKNMAFCIFDNTIKDSLKIVDWKIINLMNEEDRVVQTTPKCSCSVKQPLSKKSSNIKKECGKKAKYYKTKTK